MTEPSSQEPTEPTEPTEEPESQSLDLSALQSFSFGTQWTDAGNRNPNPSIYPLFRALALAPNGRMPERNPRATTEEASVVVEAREGDRIAAVPVVVALERTGGLRNVRLRTGLREERQDSISLETDDSKVEVIVREERTTHEAVAFKISDRMKVRCSRSISIRMMRASLPLSRY